jgi:hypothetical protein
MITVPVTSIKPVYLFQEDGVEEGGGEVVAGLGEEYSEFEDYDVVQGYDEAPLHNSVGMNMENRGRFLSNYILLISAKLLRD